jgi:hypothetical protein
LFPVKSRASRKKRSEEEMKKLGKHEEKEEGKKNIQRRNNVEFNLYINELTV